MSDPAIEIENLSKCYFIGRQSGHRDGLRHMLEGALRSPFSALRHWARGRSTTNNEFWALRDVSFCVDRGDVVGIIGRNGAGKSTLLKILSRITEPTRGRVRIRGRVASLLEVGTGFHAELTGRENIFLNGAILGMTGAEIRRKLDEIIAFSEIEQFIHTPVKRYSSGMYVRLAFSVAAHLEPEILVVDEVLAVGDAAFQKKCLGKMGDVAKEGRTVLFVSHNMAAILSLCSRAALLDAGRLVNQGPTQEIVPLYLQSAMSSETVALDQRHDRAGDGSVRMVSLEVESTDPDKVIRSDSRLKVTIGYRSRDPVRRPHFLVSINDLSNAGIFLLDSDAVGGLPDVLPPQGSVTCVTEPINLTPGRCYLNLALSKGGASADYIQNAGAFDVAPADVYGSGKIPPRDWVLCLLKHRWSMDGH